MSVLTRKQLTPQQRRDAAYNTSTGNWILLRRRALGLSQRELGEMLSVHPKTVGRWEAGVSAVSSYWISRLKDVLGDRKKEVVAQ
ncbi:MAG: helix-turn-helix transcriptional regulator [Edaphobacter sp.]